MYTSEELKNKQFRITKLWINPGEQADRSKWLDPDCSESYTGPKMNPDSRLGTVCIALALDARFNAGTIRPYATMVKFIAELCFKAGISDPEQNARTWIRTWTNEGLLAIVEPSRSGRQFTNMTEEILDICERRIESHPDRSKIERDDIYTIMADRYNWKSGFGKAITNGMMQEVAKRLGGEYIVILGRSARSHIQLPVKSAAA